MISSTIQQLDQTIPNSSSTTDPILLCTIGTLKTNQELYADIQAFPTTNIYFTNLQLDAFRYSRITGPNFNQSIYRLLSIVKSIVENEQYREYGDHLLAIMTDVYQNETIDNILCNKTALITIMEPFLNIFITNTWIKTYAESDFTTFLPYFNSLERDLGNLPAQFVADGFPFEPNLVKIAIANILKVPISALYCADGEFAALETVLWALLHVYGITPQLILPNKVLNYQLMNLSELSGYVIVYKNKVAAKVFLSKFGINNESLVAMAIIHILKAIEASTTSSDLIKLNEEVLKNTAQILQTSIDPKCTECKRKGALSQNKLVKCASTLNRNAILTVLSMYPQFEKGVKLSDIKICPIQVKTILSVFSYYEHRRITIESDVICLASLRLPDEELTITANFEAEFNELVASVSLNGTYAQFSMALMTIPLSAEFILQVVEHSYNFSGLKTTLVAATLVQFTFGINTNAQIMYEMIQKLNSLDIIQINKKLNVSDNIVYKIKLDELYVNIENLIPVDTTIIEETIRSLAKQTNIVDKISMLSRNIYSTYSIIFYWLVRMKKDRGIEKDIYLMLLFSNLSDNLKSIVYKRLKEPLIKLKNLTFNNDRGKDFAITSPSTFYKPFDFYSMLKAQNIDISSDLEDLSTYIRLQEDYHLYKLICQNEGRSRTN